MNLLYFGDRHYDESIPLNRVDDYFLNTQLKDEEIKLLGEKYNVKCFLHPGDFLNKNKVSFSKIKDIIRFWTGSQFEQLIKNQLNDNHFTQTIKSFKPLVGVYGNHDLIGGDYETRDNTLIGLLEVLGVMNMVSKEKPFFLKTEDGKTVAITGTSYHTGMDRKKYINDYIVDEKLGDYHIHIVHGMLTSKSVGSLYRHTTIDEIKETKADLTLCGHDHLGFGVIEHDGKIFANIGSVVRQKNDLKELSRKPSVLLISIDQSGLSVKEIPLKSAKEGHAVLSREKIEASLKEKAIIADFKEKTENLGLLESVDIKEILLDVAKKDSIDEEIKNEIISRLKEKEAQAATPLTCPEHIYIQRVIIENFQIHKYTELEFSKGLNILVGESRQGKSTILRAIQWVLEGKVPGKARSYIRAGEAFARVSLIFSNGMSIVRKIDLKKSGENSYTIYHPDGKIEEGNTLMLEEVQRLTGFNYFSIDKDLNVPLNILRQGSSWFLIGDNYSSSDRAKIIGALAGTHYADAVKRDLDKERNRLNERRKQIKVQIKDKEKDLLEYEYLDELKLSISSLEKVIQETKFLEEQFKHLSELSDKYEKTTEEILKQSEIIKNTTIDPLVYNQLTDLKDTLFKIQQLEKLQSSYSLDSRKMASAIKFIEQSNMLDQTKEMLLTIYEQSNCHSKIEKLETSYNKTKIDIKNAETLISETQSFDECFKLFNETKAYQHELKSVCEQAQKAEVLQSKVKKLTYQVNTLNETIDGTNHIEELKITLNDLLLEKEQLEKINRLSMTYKDTLNHLKTQNLSIEELDLKVKELIMNYQSNLESIGVCPLCHGTIDKSVISNLIKNLNLKED